MSYQQFAMIGQRVHLPFAMHFWASDAAQHLIIMFISVHRKTFNCKSDTKCLILCKTQLVTLCKVIMSRKHGNQKQRRRDRIIIQATLGLCSEISQHLINHSIQVLSLPM